MARSGLTPQDERYKSIIASRLNNLLNIQHKKQVDIHNATGIPSSTLTGYFKGRTLPTPGNVQKLADFFNVKKSAIDPRFATTDPALNETKQSNNEAAEVVAAHIDDDTPKSEQQQIINFIENLKKARK